MSIQEAPRNGSTQIEPASGEARQAFRQLERIFDPRVAFGFSELDQFAREVITAFGGENHGIRQESRIIHNGSTGADIILSRRTDNLDPRMIFTADGVAETISARPGQTGFMVLT